jgi:WD40 repeat protein
VTGAFGGFDLYVARRASVDEPWGMPQNLGSTVNTTGTDNIPAFSRDGHWMFFNSNRGGSIGDVDLWVSYRAHVRDDFAWETPLNLGQGVNTTGFDGGASYFENEEGGTPLLFYGSGATQATSDIWVAELRGDGTFGNARRIDELSTAAADQRPMIRFDGLEIFFFSNRDGSTPGPTGALSSDIWVATRKSILEPWAAPVNLGPTINSPSNEINPYLSADGTTLYFASSRPDGCGGNDLYMTTRTKLKGKD